MPFRAKRRRLWSDGWAPCPSAGHYCRKHGRVAGLERGDGSVGHHPKTEKNALELMRQEDMLRFGKKMSPAEAILLDEIMKSLMQKVLK